MEYGIFISWMIHNFGIIMWLPAFLISINNYCYCNFSDSDLQSLYASRNPNTCLLISSMYESSILGFFNCYAIPIFWFPILKFTVTSELVVSFYSCVIIHNFILHATSYVLTARLSFYFVNWIILYTQVQMENIMYVWETHVARSSYINNCVLMLDKGFTFCSCANSSWNCTWHKLEQRFSCFHIRDICYNGLFCSRETSWIIVFSHMPLKLLTLCLCSPFADIMQCKSASPVFLLLFAFAFR